ncbi:MAG: hypothetical protein ACRCU6_11240 [Fusobacteriaceae bacterium]
MSSTNQIEILHKEIDIIQNCINRMASNSFLIKGWFIALILGFITFGYEKIDLKILIIISLIITILCWVSDAFFLQIERKYRKKYNWIIKNRCENSDFLYNLDPNESSMWDSDDKTKIGFWEVFFSKTLSFIYGLSIIIFIIAIVFKIITSNITYIIIFNA